MATEFQRHRAIVLRRTNYGEADRIVNFITPDGPVATLAKGVRKQNSKLAGGLELLCLVDIVVTKSPKLGRLTSTKLIEFYGEIIKNYDRLQFAYRVLKLVDRYSQGISDGAWFDLTKQALTHLNQPTVDLRLIQAWVYLKIADLLGSGLNLITDTDGDKLEADKKYAYNWVDKGLVLADGGSLTTDHLKLLRLLSASELSLAVRVANVQNLLDDVCRVAIEHAGLSE